MQRGSKCRIVRETRRPRLSEDPPFLGPVQSASGLWKIVSDSEVKYPPLVQMAFLVETREALPLKPSCFFTKHVKVVVHLGMNNIQLSPPIINVVGKSVSQFWAIIDDKLQHWQTTIKHQTISTYLNIDLKPASVHKSLNRRSQQLQDRSTSMSHLWRGRCLSHSSPVRGPYICPVRAKV